MDITNLTFKDIYTSKKEKEFTGNLSEKDHEWQDLMILKGAIKTSFESSFVNAVTLTDLNNYRTFTTFDYLLPNPI